MKRFAVALFVAASFAGILHAQQNDPFPFMYTNGKAFVEDGGERRWVWCGASDFKLWANYMSGQDIAPVLRQRKDTGANILRVFMMYDNPNGLGKFHPWEQQWASSLRAFAPLVGSYGLRVEYVVFADAQTAMPDKRLQQQWWHDVTLTLRDYANFSFVELANEWPQNGVNPLEFQRPPPEWRLLASRGSSVGDAPPWGSYSSAYFAPWDYDTWHGRRDWPKYVWSAEDGWYVGEGKLPDQSRYGPPHPIVHDEPIGFAEVAVAGRRASDTHSAQDVALSGRMLSGATFHSDQGIESELWTGRQLTAAQAFYRACNAFIEEDY